LLPVIARFGYIEPLNQTDMETWRRGGKRWVGGVGAVDHSIVAAFHQ
jgi:hypothetical protein